MVELEEMGLSWGEVQATATSRNRCPTGEEKDK